jgi:hypothetical protein
MDRQFKLAIIFGDPVIIFDNDFVVARYASPGVECGQSYHTTLFMGMPLLIYKFDD